MVYREKMKEGRFRIILIVFTIILGLFLIGRNEYREYQFNHLTSIPYFQRFKPDTVCINLYRSRLDLLESDIEKLNQLSLLDFLVDCTIKFDTITGTPYL